jgi:RNA polymerase sigma-70 factor (ECF subfamily)
MESSDNPADFETFFRQEIVGLTALAMWVCDDRATAEDLAQEAMVRTLTRWSRVRTFDNPSAYTRRILVNLASNERRRARRSLARALRFRSAERDEDEATSRSEWTAWPAAANLPIAQRVLVALVYGEGYPIAEAAEIAGCAPSTARVHLLRARAALAAAVERAEVADDQNAEGDNPERDSQGATS